MKCELQKIDTIIKLSAVIAIERKTSLLGQKLFNILFANAYKRLSENISHSITVKSLLEYIPSASNVTHLRKTLKEMCIPVEFNIFDKDKGNKWGFFALLPEAVIEPGTGLCTYSFTKVMCDLMSKSDKMYANINLLIQQRYKGGKYGWFLYELCFDYKDIPGGGKTPLMTLELLKKYLGIEKKKYSTFKRFNYEVLKPAMKDLDKFSNIKVRVDIIKTGRKVTHIQFFIETIIPIPTIPESKPKAFTALLSDLGLSEEEREAITSKYSSEQIEHAFKICLKNQKKGTVINSKAAYFQQVLTKNQTIQNAFPEAPEDKEATAKEQALQDETVKADAELYKKSTDAEKFEIMLGESKPLRSAYESLTEENQEHLKVYAYVDVFPSFSGFKVIYTHVMREALELKKNNKKG